MGRIRNVAACAAAALLLASASAAARDKEIVYLDMRPLLQADYDDSLSVLDVWDRLHTVSTLQGIVNRHSPRLYINYVVNGDIDVDTYWWDKYRQPGQWLAGRDSVGCSSVEDAVRMFSKRLKGAVVYDSGVASTSNVASAIAGIDDLLAVRYDRRPGSLYTRLVEGGPRLPVKVWLVNSDGTHMFTGKGTLPGCDRPSSGSLKCDPYLWFIEKYMKTGRCDGAYAGYYLDQKWRDMVHRATYNHHQLTNHDFFVSRRGFFFDLSPWADEPATDDTLQATGTDQATLRELLGEAYRLGRGRRMCYIGGFPAWAFKYTRHAGGKHEDVETEWHFSELISHYAAFKDADAIAYGALANASFWQHFPLRKYPQRWTSKEELARKGLIDADGKVRTDRQYVVIYMGDYDASSWVSQRTPDLWDHPSRGHLPIMWCISPVLAERVPHALHYIRSTASSLDYFAAADNGAGYMIPSIAESEDARQGVTTRIDTWAKHCRRYYKRWGLTVSGFIIDANGPAMGDRALDAYASFSPNGIVPQKTRGDLLHGNMPILPAGYDLVDDDSRRAARVLTERLRVEPMPFHWFRCVLKSPQWYEQVVQEARRIDPSVTLLSAPEFFELYRLWLSERHDAR